MTVKPLIELYDAVDSTNDVAKILFHSKSAPHGTIVRANFQTKGRGRQGNFWESAPHENLLFSLILLPKQYAPSLQFIINKIIAVVLADFLQSMVAGFPVKIKWPNDIYIENKKIAGILIEHAILGETLSRSVVGIGVNINQTTFESAPNPVSLKMITGHDYDIGALCENLSEKILTAFAETASDDAQEWAEPYHRRLYQLDERKKYLIDGRERHAVILGVSEDGRLVLQYDDGATHCHELNSIKYL